jgi:hypothetical protein
MLEDSGGTAEYMAKTQLDNLSGSFEYMTGALDGVVMTL